MGKHYYLIMPGPGRDKEVSDEEILHQIALHPDAVVTAKEVGELIGMTPQGTTKRLQELAKSEYLVRKKVGAHAVVYWITPEGKEFARDS